MATIITREVGATAKNSELTNAELDANFININTELDTLSNAVGVEVSLPNCTNNIGSTIPKGSVVMVTGMSNDQYLIAPAISNGAINDNFLIGILKEDLLVAGTNGKVLIRGVVSDFNVGSWASNTLLYSDASSAGSLTTTKPVYPANSDIFASVLKEGTAGSIFVNVRSSRVDRTIGREYTSTSDPTVNEDSNSGYTIWSKVLNTNTNTIFICTNASVGAAVWVAIN